MNPWIWGWINYGVMVAALILGARLAGQNATLRAQLNRSMQLLDEQQVILKQQQEMLGGQVPAPGIRIQPEDDGRRDI